MTLDDVLERSAILEFDAGRERFSADRQAWEEVMGEQPKFSADVILFASSPADDQSVCDAKDFITKNKLTKDDVSIKKSDKVVYVITKKECYYGE